MTNENNSSEMIIYEGADGATGIEARVEGEAVWQMFGIFEQL